MTTRRTPIHRARRPHLTPEMRVKAERLLALTKAHREAITSGSDDFYDDGRHHELVALMPEVNAALGIMPWKDDVAALEAALEQEN